MWGKIRIAIAFLLASLALSPACLAQDTYSNPGLGFSVHKPSGWHYMSTEQYKENLSQLNNQQTKELAQKYATTPFVTITKYDQETYTDLNPSMQVKVRNAGAAKGMPPEKLAVGMIKVLTSVLKDVVVVEGPAVIELAGHSAAYTRVNFTAEIRGHTRPTTSEMWIVPRNDQFFIIVASTRQDEKNGTRKEIRNIIDTIKIE